MAENVNYPEMLYKFRRGIAAYKHIEGNVYEDTTCRDHPNCRISVKPVGDHFDLLELLNDSAKEYSYFHKVTEFDSFYYPTKNGALREIFNDRIRAFGEELQKNIEALPRAEQRLAEWRPMEIKPQRIEDVDFDDHVWLLYKRYSDYEVKGDIVVKRKIVEKKGVVRLEAPDSYFIENSSDFKYLEVEERTYSEYSEHDDYDSDFYLVFVSKEDRDAFLNNFNKEVFERSVKSIRDSIEYNREKVEEFKRKYNEVKED